jgi:hypothetical protein
MEKGCRLEFVGEVGGTGAFDAESFESRFAPRIRMRVVQPAIRVKSDHIVSKGEVVAE